MVGIFNTIKDIPVPEADYLSKIEVQRGIQITMGQEIEQKTAEFFRIRDKCSYLEEKRNGAPDYPSSHAPFEWQYGPFSNPATWLHYFYDIDFPENEMFEWDNMNEYDRPCGCHTHFRPETSTSNSLKIWTITWNTLSEMHLFLLPLQIFTPQCRNMFMRFSYPIIRRMTSDSMRRELSFTQRGFESITLNPAERNHKPLTIELRTPESPPIFLATNTRILAYFVRNAIKNGFSPKLTEESRKKIVYAARRVGAQGNDPYDELASTGRIVFERLTVFDLPHMNRKREFNNALDFLKATCDYLMKLYPRAKRFKDYFSRCLWFIMNEGWMRDERNENFWKCFTQKKNFQWYSIREYRG